MRGIVAVVIRHAEELNRRGPRWLAAFAALASASAFLVSGYLRARRFPVPLDDTFIHFSFARSAALGHPFEWIPGNGYSSGATSLVYPFALAPAWLLGFRGARLAIFAAALAVVATIDFARSLVKIAPRAAWFSAVAVVAIPLLDWSLWSGMEVALFAAVLGRALVAFRRAEASPAHLRARAQLGLGWWLALLVATRPESAAIACALAVAATHAARSRGTLASLARSSLPFSSLLAAQAVMNRALTGEWAAAGAIRKLLTSNPYLGGPDVAIEVVKNFVVLRGNAFGVALGGAAPVFLALAVVAVASRRSRRLALALAIGGALTLALVAFNATARFQNLRYAAPSLEAMIAVAALGVAAVAERSRALAASVAALAIALPTRELGRQIEHFARASKNIADQQIEVAARVEARAPKLVFLGDAGAIPYLSGARALDGLGLGGFRGLPFARASVHGVPAVIELLERIDPKDRPDLLAIYPGWWEGIPGVFGAQVDAVRIDDNVICGADEKVLYAADWSKLAPPHEREDGAIDAIDVGDLVDEALHDFEMPARGGWMIGGVHEDERGRARFDGGRIVPEGERVSFRLLADPPREATLAIRTDAGEEMEVTVARASPDDERRVTARRREGDRWFRVDVPLDGLARGERVTLRASRGELRIHHAWIFARAEPRTAEE